MIIVIDYHFLPLQTGPTPTGHTVNISIQTSSAPLPPRSEGKVWPRWEARVEGAATPMRSCAPAPTPVNNPRARTEGCARPSKLLRAGKL